VFMGCTSSARGFVLAVRLLADYDSTGVTVRHTARFSKCGGKSSLHF
jgi:hypothetical protein